MKTPEDEAFDELAKKQGDWGGGFPAKRAMAEDKLQEPSYAKEKPKLMLEKFREMTNLLNDTTPPQSPWVGLTEKEFDLIMGQHSPQAGIDFWERCQQFYAVIEAKLKDKNT
jgi:hypothetical protein